MNHRRYSTLFLLLLTLFLAVSVYAVVQSLQNPTPISSPFVAFSMYVLLIFLTILILRYFFLMWFSYLAHLEELLQENTPVFSPMVSIIIPAFNEGMVIEQSIQSLLKLDYPHFEIIVIDDGSWDDTAQKASKYEGVQGPNSVRVRVVTQLNGGKARALNRGISLAEGALILCMDGDSQLTPQSLKAAVRHFVDPTIGAVAGNVKVINRGSLLGKLQALEYIEGLNLVRKAQGFFRVVNIIPGPIGIFRKQVLEQAGYYNADTYAEDCDITLHILMNGWKIQYEPGAIAYTEAPDTIRDLFKQRYRWTRGILQAIRKHKGALFSTQFGLTNTLMLWYMLFEALIWPALNVLSNALFVVMGFGYGFSHFAVFWWLQLTVLDLGAALYCVAMERESLRLIPYSIFYRLFFILAVDVCKLTCTIDELLGLRMSWGKLERSGRH